CRRHRTGESDASGRIGDPPQSPLQDSHPPKIAIAVETTRARIPKVARHAHSLHHRLPPRRAARHGRVRRRFVAIPRRELHDLRSATKSIVGLLYGIALAAGKVPAPDQKLLAQFPEYPDLAGDPRRAAWTVGHVLTMTLGTEWDEQLSYTDPRNSETAMDGA